VPSRVNQRLLKPPVDYLAVGGLRRHPFGMIGCGGPVQFFTARVIFICMLFFADRGERAVVQALLMGAVVSVIVTLLILLQFLDDPFHGGVAAGAPLPTGARKLATPRRAHAPVLNRS
jgi:hypothetical protein